MAEIENKITACDKCLRASCWQGLFFCEDYMTAGTIEKTVEELRDLNLENECYWKEASHE
jgi:hypothetical protein